jgi:hypothetical protein
MGRWSQTLTDKHSVALLGKECRPQRHHFTQHCVSKGVAIVGIRVHLMCVAIDEDSKFFKLIVRQVSH